MVASAYRPKHFEESSVRKFVPELLVSLRERSANPLSRFNVREDVASRGQGDNIYSHGVHTGYKLFE